MVKGTHILINASSEHFLTEPEGFREFILECLRGYKLVQVGQVFHTFDTGGFTCVIGLTESHLALHTWPELGYYTCDIYLCDYSRDNSQLTRELGRRITDYFQSFNIKEQVIDR